MSDIGQITDSPPPLYFSQQDSLRNHRAWKANCGPHALAASAGLTLEEVRGYLINFRGWMNPTMIEDALDRMGIHFRLTKGLKTPHLCEGIARIQWEGPWLASVRESYQHTHWVAHRRDWVLCSSVSPWQWIRRNAWSQALDTPWHITHHFEFREPVRIDPVPGQQFLALE